MITRLEFLAEPPMGPAGHVRTLQSAWPESRWMAAVPAAALGRFLEVLHP
ncbi:hypothetical protein [Streptomyces brasiliensis]|nr:hypothetical protein [Streptomyces brasiliensis]